MNVLVTGGFGYIGSHICAKLIQGKHNLTIIDSGLQSGNNALYLRSLADETGVVPSIFNLDIRSLNQYSSLCSSIFKDIDVVIHCAALKSVLDSFKNPQEYYDVNVGGSLAIITAMQRYMRDKKIVFAFSSAVYADASAGVNHSFHRNSRSPYGESKSMVEKILLDIHISDKSWDITVLNYFNPMGYGFDDNLQDRYNKYGLIHNIMHSLNTGDAFILNDSLDDPKIRKDFIHINHLVDRTLHFAIGTPYKHVLGDYAQLDVRSGVNLKLIDIIKAFEKVSGKTINVFESPRRAGDGSHPYSKYRDNFCKNSADPYDYGHQANLEEMCDNVYKNYRKILQ
jgi:UDP-glucose 4-epimerase